MKLTEALDAIWPLVHTPPDSDFADLIGRVDVQFIGK